MSRKITRTQNGEEQSITLTDAAFDIHWPKTAIETAIKNWAEEVKVTKTDQEVLEN